ncbi:MAG TPA: lysozyme inhibitor LprI family protein [Allosphingosinicella sp.]|nr:lysozyme inhibitor LprI family protein [Allosphingosinicella sp.]
MSEGARGNCKLILIFSALLAGCGGGTPGANEANVQKAGPQASARPAPFDWGNPDGDRNPQFARSQALCRSVQGSEPPAADRPDAATAAALRGCDAEALYYGIGVARNPERARLCAFTQTQNDPLTAFSGRPMLMTIYANGVGARRNLDVALHLACTLPNAAAFEYDQRVIHLARLRDTNWQGRDFHYCNDITSGLSDGVCAAHRYALARPQREATMRRLLASWTEEERRAFEPLRRAFEDFVRASSDGDLSGGTSASAMRTRLEQGLRDQFVDMLQKLSTGRDPRFTPAQFRTEDLQLNQAYRARLADEREYDAPGTSVEAMQNAQRAWLRYRDAFIAFARVKYPRVQRESLAAWITRNRSEIIPGLNSSL